LRVQEERKWILECWSVHPVQERVCVHLCHHLGGSDFLHLLEFQVEAAHHLWSPS